MTPAEQAARAIVLAWANEDTYVGGEPTLREQERLTKRIAAAIKQARREEREACAMTALHWYDLPDEITDQAEPHTVEGMIAAAIRARAQEETR